MNISRIAILALSLMVMVSCHVPDNTRDASSYPNHARPLLSQDDLRDDAVTEFKGLRHTQNRASEAVVWRDVTNRDLSMRAASRNMPVQIGDQIRIIVYRERDLSNLFTVSDDGTIDYPLLGRLEVAGLSPAQIAQKVRDTLRGDYLIAPHVMADRVEFCAENIAVSAHDGHRS